MRRVKHLLSLCTLAFCLWSCNPLPPDALWRMDLGSSVVSQPVLPAGGSTLYIADISGMVSAIQTGDGALKWEHALETPVAIPLLYLNDVIYVLAENGIIYALDPADGHIIAQSEALFTLPPSGILMTNGARLAAISRLEKKLIIVDALSLANPVERNLEMDLLPESEVFWTISSDNTIYVKDSQARILIYDFSANLSATFADSRLTNTVPTAISGSSLITVVQNEETHELPDLLVLEPDGSNTRLAINLPPEVIHYNPFNILIPDADHYTLTFSTSLNTTDMQFYDLKSYIVDKNTGEILSTYILDKGYLVNCLAPTLTSSTDLIWYEKTTTIPQHYDSSVIITSSSRPAQQLFKFDGVMAQICPIIANLSIIAVSQNGIVFSIPCDTGGYADAAPWGNMYGGQENHP